MENQINHPESEKRVSTTVGVVILVLVSIIIMLVFWKLRDDSNLANDVQLVPMPQVKVQEEAPVSSGIPADNSSAGAAGSQTVIDKIPLDFDKEMNDLDTAAGSVDSDDFGDSGLSDANLGL